MGNRRIAALCINFLCLCCLGGCYFEPIRGGFQPSFSLVTVWTWKVKKLFWSYVLYLNISASHFVQDYPSLYLWCQWNDFEFPFPLWSVLVGGSAGKRIGTWNPSIYVKAKKVWEAHVIPALRRQTRIPGPRWLPNYLPRIGELQVHQEPLTQYSREWQRKTPDIKVKCTQIHTGIHMCVHINMHTTYTHADNSVQDWEYLGIPFIVESLHRVTEIKLNTVKIQLCCWNNVSVILFYITSLIFDTWIKVNTIWRRSGLLCVLIKCLWFSRHFKLFKLWT